MNIQKVPIKADGYFLDYTYCANENCENKCGRKMSNAIKEAISKMAYSRVSYADFCKEAK